MGLQIIFLHLTPYSEGIREADYVLVFTSCVWFRPIGG